MSWESAPFLVRPTGLWLVSLALLRTIAFGATEVSPDVEWQSMRRLLFNDAARGFERSADAPAAKLGRAIALLNVQPRTDTNLDLADQVLADVERNGPAPEAAAAAYHRARILALHRNMPDLPAARAAYAAVAQRWPGEFFGQLAQVKLASLELYAPESDAAAFARWERAAANCTDAVVRRSFHLLLGEVAQRLRLGDEAAYRHYTAALALGLKKAELRGAIRLRLGRLAAGLGRREEAATHYRAFLEENPRDERASDVAAQIIAWEAGR